MFENLKGKAEEAKQFVVKYQVPLTATAAVGITYAMMRDKDVRILKNGIFELALSIRELADRDKHTLTMAEFIDSKNLREEFFRFDEMRNVGVAQYKGIRQ